MPDRSRRALGALAGFFCLWATLVSAEMRLQFVGSYEWDRPTESVFGGFSALVLDDDGLGFTALSDRGTLYTGVLERENGLIAGVSDVTHRPLLSAKGEKLDHYLLDSEGLARSDDGRLYVSFEGFHRVMFLTPGQNRLRWLERAPDFEDLQSNSGLEALALDLQGRPIAIPERSGRLDRPFPVYRLERGKWSVPYSVPRRGEFLVVGADTGPDGRLYILERHFSGIFGFSNRVRSFAFGTDGLEDERVLLVSRIGQYDNLEGLSVWRDEDGIIHVAMISDDNFKFFQRTEFVEYQLVEEPTG